MTVKELLQAIEDQKIDLNSKVYIELDTEEVYDVENPRYKNINGRYYLVISIV